MAKQDGGRRRLRIEPSGDQQTFVVHCVLNGKPVVLTVHQFLKLPSASQIREKRDAAGLTQTQAARLVYASPRTWQDWERGERRMPLAAWEFFNLLLEFESVRLARQQWYERMSFAA